MEMTLLPNGILEINIDVCFIHTATFLYDACEFCRKCVPSLFLGQMFFFFFFLHPTCKNLYGQKSIKQWVYNAALIKHREGCGDVKVNQGSPIMPPAII